MEERGPHPKSDFGIVRVVIHRKIPRIAESARGDEIPDHEPGHVVRRFVRMESEFGGECSGLPLQSGRQKPKKPANGAQFR